MTASPPPPRPTPADAVFPDPSAPAWTGAATEAGPGEASGPDLLPSGGSARYEPGSLLGEGGMGTVRVARDRVLLRDVAFKELSPRLGGRADARRRMAREAWITSQLDHPGIVAVHDAGTLPDGRPFYAMRLVRGRSLAEALAEAPDARARLALVRHFLAACEAVAYAHDAGIVHRDLKPANILIGAFGETQVVDWGLARPTEAAEPAWRDSLPEDADAGRTALGAVVGTHRGRVAVFDLVGRREVHHSDTPLGTVKRLRLSPDGGRAAVSGTRGDVRVLDVGSGRWVASLPAAPGSAVAFPTADTLVVAGRDVSRWSLPDGPPRHLFPTSAGVSDLAPSPDGSRLALALGDGHVQVVDLATGQSDGFLPLGRGVAKAVGYSRDGALLATTGTQGRRLVAVDARTFRPGPVLPPLSMRRLAFLAGGEVLGLVYGGGLHRVRPSVAGDPGERFNLDRDGMDLATSPDGGYAVALDLGGGLYGIAPGKAVERLATVPDALAADVSRGGQLLAVATGEEVRVMDAAGEVVLRIPAPGAGIRDVALSPDGRILAAGGLDGVARIWSVEGGALLAELHGHGDRIARVEFGPDGSWLATGSWDRSARRWDLSGLSRPVATVVEEVRRDWGGEDGEVPGGG